MSHKSSRSGVIWTLWGQRDWGEWLLGTSSTQFLLSIPRSWATTFPGRRISPHLAETEPPAFVAIIWGSCHRKEMISLNRVSPKTGMRVVGVYSDLQSLQKKHFHIHHLSDSHHNPARCPFVAEETEAPKG